MSKTKIKKLQDMVGKSWKHSDETVYKFLSCNVDGDQCMIATDKEWLKPTIYNLDVFFEQYTEINENTGITLVTQEAGQVSQSSFASNGVFKKLGDTLLSDIEKLRTDKDYIPQAKQISESIKTFVDLAKVEIEMKTKL